MSRDLVETLAVVVLFLGGVFVLLGATSLGGLVAGLALIAVSVILGIQNT